MQNSDLISLHQLLLEHSKVPKRQAKPTFLEIAGVQSRENVCSNILSFFLNPANPHGLDDLLLTALANAVPAINAKTFVTPEITVHREFPTLNGGRIDLVIETATHVVAIENKIFHWLANDLADYWRTIDSIAAGRTPVGIVLSLHSLTPTHKDFHSLTFSDLYRHVETFAGRYVDGTDLSYLQLMVGLFKTMQNLKGTTMDKQEFMFFVNNSEAITRIVSGKQAYFDEVSRKLSQFAGAVQPPSGFKQWIWQPKNFNTWESPRLVDDISINGSMIGIDTYITVNEQALWWRILFFHRGKHTPPGLFAFFGDELKQFPLEGNRFVAAEICIDPENFDTSMSATAEALQMLLSRFSAEKAAKEASFASQS